MVELANLLRLPNLLYNTEEESLISLVTSLEPSLQIPAESLHGQFSIATKRDDFYYLIRDRLGINKLFYHLDKASQVLTVANFVSELADSVQDFNGIFSVPPGFYLKIHSVTGGKELINYYDISRVESCSLELFDFKRFAEQTRASLTNLFESLNRKYKGSRFVVCLSGGLDSSIVASFAKRFLDSVVATTFTYGSPEKSSKGASVSEDFSAASKIATTLQLPFIPIVKEKHLDLETLDEILLRCQDWRDFNVHCAWLNYQIGKEIRLQFPDEHLIFLTGDLMNEFVADYTPVVYKDTTYYPQPKISRDRFRRFLIYGLDTSDREVGIFHHWNITTIQPFSILAESYLSIPEEVIQLSNCKELLNLPLVSDSNIETLVVKTKVRAQVGGSNGGTLGLFHDSKLTQSKLKERWDSLFARNTRGVDTLPFIISGRYRS